MKRVYLFALLLCLLPLGIAAQQKTNKFVFSLSPSIGFLNGQAEEIVYREEGSNDKLSQLLWNMNPLVYVGIDFDFERQNRRGFFADASFKFGFPGKTGLMEDRDWADRDYEDFLTHYSVHNNNTKEAIMINAHAGTSFSVFNAFLLKLYLSYDCMSFSWTASGGSFLYPKYSDGEEGHGYLISDIDVGTYKQTWHIVSPAIAFSGTFNRYFNAEISLKASPFIACFTGDNHIWRSLIITENMQWGFFIEPMFILSFTPKDNFSLSFSVSYKNISKVRGDGEYDYSDGSTPDVTVKDMVGAGYSVFDAGLIARFVLSGK